jgi:hypothetical protein
MATTATRVTPVVTKIIDGDGHLYERDEDIIPYLQGKYPEETLRTYYLFPTLDGWRRGLPPRGHRYDAAGWAQFMDDTGISEAVLYPTLAWLSPMPETPTGRQNSPAPIMTMSMTIS